MRAFKFNLFKVAAAWDGNTMVGVEVCNFAVQNRKTWGVFALKFVTGKGWGASVMVLGFTLGIHLKQPDLNRVEGDDILAVRVYRFGFNYWQKPSPKDVNLS